MKKKIFTLLTFMYIFFNAQPVLADYVLPYPSYMPGNKLYKISRLTDQLKEWWYWGSIAQTKYHLMLADKYLVEAKTLFEYNQYLLAVQALNRSDLQFKLVLPYMDKAGREGKDISKLKDLIGSAIGKHISVLKKLKSELPQEFTWTPEKAKPTTLNLGQILDESINVRHSIP